MNLSKLTIATLAALALAQATNAEAANKKYLNKQTYFNLNVNKIINFDVRR